MFVSLIDRKIEECRVGDQLAIRESQFTQALPVSEKSSNWIIANLSALVKVNFKDIGAILSKGNYGVVFKLLAIIEFELRLSAGSLKYRARKN